MTDPYRITEENAPSAAPRTTARTGTLRPVLWIVLALSLAAEMVAEAAGLGPVVGSAFGVVALASVVGLVIDYRRSRTR